jgi:hypothetical protein
MDRLKNENAEPQHHRAWLASDSEPSGFAQTTNAPRFLPPVKPDGDTPVVLEWESNPAGIYTVEYSVGLTNNWWLGVEGLPSQGTATRWTDRGNPAPDQFRFSSGDASAAYRFYRVKQDRLMDTNLPITVTVTSPAGSATLSGAVQIQGSASASQGIASVKLYVDGHLVMRGPGPTFDLPLETRFFANGSHRISVIAEDIGAIESTEETNSFSGREASYGVANVNVVFDNLLSNARARYEHFRPELGQTQQVFAAWSSPRDWRVDVTSGDGATVYRSFSGSGKRVVIDWDGRNNAGQYLNPQAVGYLFNDLGAAPAPPPGGGGGGSPPSPLMTAVLAGESAYSTAPPPMPPVKFNGKWTTWEEAYGSLRPTEFKISDKQRASVLAALETSVTMSESIPSGIQGAEAAGQAFAIVLPYSLMGTIAIAGQGHHPYLDPFGRYPTPDTWFGNVRMSSTRQYGPWGPLKRVKGILDEASQEFSKMGYSVIDKKLDDQVQPNDIAQPFGPPNMFNLADIGLYVGHSVAARDAEASQWIPHAYIPIYNRTTDTMTFVGSYDMWFGSPVLKWMAFFSCNMFRDDLYRSDGIYGPMKNWFQLPMNGYLHIMQGYATEMSVHPDMPFWWTLALRKSAFVEPRDHTVIGAWNFVCRTTQKNANPADPLNIARSVYWPECGNDFILGYGSQTEPNRDPLEQADLVETDEPANAP